MGRRRRSGRVCGRRCATCGRDVFFQFAVGYVPAHFPRASRQSTEHQSQGTSDSSSRYCFKSPLRYPGHAPPPPRAGPLLHTNNALRVREPLAPQPQPQPQPASPPPSRQDAAPPGPVSL